MAARDGSAGGPDGQAGAESMKIREAIKRAYVRRAIEAREAAWRVRVLARRLSNEELDALDLEVAETLQQRLRQSLKGS